MPPVPRLFEAATKLRTATSYTDAVLPLQAFRDAQGGNESLYQWRGYFSRTVQLLAEQGNFDDLR